jgi:hypothetical protein
MESLEDDQIKEENLGIATDYRHVVLNGGFSSRKDSGSSGVYGDIISP